MDYLRSAYEVDMVFRTGDTPLSVRWRKASPGALVFPDWHSYFSANWDERECKAGDIGEQPGNRPWSNGKIQDVPNGSVIGCEPLEWFKTGLAVSENGATFTNCLVACCGLSSEAYWNGDPVPDRIRFTYFHSGSPTCSIAFQTGVMTRREGKSVWYYEKRTLISTCYYVHRIRLERTGPNPSDWNLRSEWQTLPFGAPINSAGLTFGTSSPFFMSFFFPAYVTSYWSMPVTVTLTEP